MVRVPDNVIDAIAVQSHRCLRRKYAIYPKFIETTKLGMESLASNDSALGRKEVWPHQAYINYTIGNMNNFDEKPVEGEGMRNDEVKKS